MANETQKQRIPGGDGKSVKIGEEYLATIARLARESRKTQRVVIEEHLDIAFKMRRIEIAGPRP